jgi:putative two-component system protein, hydrogenase maturation factor HypX/HoxX
VQAPFTPVGAAEAVRIGLLDAAFGTTPDAFHARTRSYAERLAQRVDSEGLLEQKRRRRARDEQLKPLQAYRNEELARSHRCFFGPDRSYHEARPRFCHKLAGARTVAPRAESVAPSLRRSA